MLIYTFAKKYNGVFFFKILYFNKVSMNHFNIVLDTISLQKFQKNIFIAFLCEEM
jgi:hypothetical protein